MKNFSIVVSLILASIMFMIAGCTNKERDDYFGDYKEASAEQIIEIMQKLESYATLEEKGNMKEVRNIFYSAEGENFKQEFSEEVVTIFDYSQNNIYIKTTYEMETEQGGNTSESYISNQIWFEFTPSKEFSDRFGIFGYLTTFYISIYGKNENGETQKKGKYSGSGINQRALMYSKMYYNTPISVLLRDVFKFINNDDVKFYIDGNKVKISRQCESSKIGESEVAYYIIFESENTYKIKAERDNNGFSYYEKSEIITTDETVTLPTEEEYNKKIEPSGLLYIDISKLKFVQSENN